ncbi:MAG: hypothetical protein BGP14_00165 [Sphingobacteriales bacterium 44-15]|nr:MAG: hypothetical protein BGP14_00165 [Sphingobacteriales bacterium 44-15]
MGYTYRVLGSLNFFVVFACPIRRSFRRAKNLTVDRQALYFLYGYFLPHAKGRKAWLEGIYNQPLARPFD